jgi:rubrerythrin
MHHLKLKAAVAKFSPLVSEGKTGEEIKEVITADEKGYSPEEVEEILAAITTAPPEQDKPASNNSPFQDFELWNVTVETKTTLNENMDKVVTNTPVKKGEKAVRTVRIEQRHADELNAQFTNSKQFYYLKA